MSGRSDTVQLSQGLWADRAASPAAPLWQRVVFTALTHHGDDGVTVFGSGELAGLLRDKSGRPTSIVDVAAAVRAAVEFGWLRPGSTALRLVLADGTLAALDNALASGS